MSLPHLSCINSPSILPLNGWITKDALPSHMELGCVPGWQSQWAIGRLRRCRKWNSELSVQRAEEAPGVGDTLSRTGSLSLDTCLDWHLLLAPWLRPPGLGSQYSALRSPCCRAPSSFPRHSSQHFCAFIDQSGLTMFRQGVGVAVNLHPGELRMGPGCIPGHHLLQCSHSSSWTPSTMRKFRGQSDILRNVFLMLTQIYQEDLMPFAYSYHLTSCQTTRVSL